jgi:PilZ domain
MENQDARRSDRVPLELPITVSGTDCLGSGFVEQTRTTMLGRHGAKILLKRKLVPEQEINVRCLKTGRETDARVVGQTGGDEEVYSYGVELLDPNVDLWDIQFPPEAEPQAAVGRVLLSCVRCRHQELAHLDEFEMEVLEATNFLSRHCSRCNDTNLWVRPSGEEVEGAAPAAAPPGAEAGTLHRKRTRNDRKFVRMDLEVEVCIHHAQYGEEIAKTVNVSRGGFRFKSRKGYGEGWVIEAALPYSPGAANIFTPGRIVYTGELREEGIYVYGVMYIPKAEAARWT